LRDVTVIGNPDLYAGLFAEDAPLQFAEPLEEPALIGAGTTHHIAWRAKDDAEQQAWLARLAEGESELEDPDGLRLRVYPGPAPRLRDVSVIGNPDLYAGLFAEDAPLHFAEPLEEPALIGAGTAHHIAWRTKDDADQQAWLARLTELGLRPTPIQDRKYFHSVYFRMPDGILIEIATDAPGFLVDEPQDSLGHGLSLPPWLEPERETLERELTPVE